MVRNTFDRAARSSVWIEQRRSGMRKWLTVFQPVLHRRRDAIITFGKNTDAEAIHEWKLDSRAVEMTVTERRCDSGAFRWK
jgi:hypothetical protein